MIPAADAGRQHPRQRHGTAQDMPAISSLGCKLLSRSADGDAKGERDAG